MTTEQLEQIEELARRAVACKRWRWMPGMRTTEGWRVIRNRTESSCMAYDENPENWQVADNYFQDGKIPDLRDPATLGCLLALVREAWGPTASVSVNLSGFWAVGGATVLSGKGKGSSINLGIWKNSELEALVAALEVAP